MTSAVVLPTPPRFPRVLLPASLPDNPTDLEAAQASGWFSALRKALTEMHPEGVMAALSASGMRGRGFPGVPLGDKWESCRRAQGDRKYVVVNAYQADPSVVTDRVLIERNPYAVFEGAAIAAFTVGAQEIIFAVRAEATDAIRTLEAAIAVAQKAGYLGDNVLNSGLELQASVRALEGSYMIGEETVLLKGLEGKRGHPEQQPPYTTTRGLWGKPTLIHGPQTFAAVPTIINGGNEEYPETAPRAFAGTILVQISGAVVQPGVYKLPSTARISNALDSAGGARPEADLNALNLARKLNDGEAIVIPTRKAPAAASTAVSTSSPGSPGATARPGKINLNVATVEQLDTLPGIGPALAQRIVDYRNQNGPFKKIEEVKNVKGIGDSLFDGIKTLITTDDVEGQ